MLQQYKESHLHGAALVRPYNYPERLAQFILENQNVKFEWGRMDCARFAIRCQIATFGFTPWPEFLTDKRISRKAAMKIIKDLGHNSLWDLVDTRQQRVHNVLMAKRGDIVGHYVKGEEAMGVMLGTCFVNASRNGLVYAPVTQATIAWEV